MKKRVKNAPELKNELKAAGKTVLNRARKKGSIALHGKRSRSCN
jgi:hypothetical protein